MSAPVSPSPPPADGVLTCGVCGAGSPVTARFCGVCGSRLLFHCWSCGTVAVVGQRFCQACGAELVLPESARQGLPRPTTPAVLPTAALPTAVLPTAALPTAALDTSGAPAACCPLAPAPLPEAAPAPAPPPLPEPARPAVPDAAPGDAAAEAPDGDGEDDTLVEERRLVTVLFADIVGFTTLSERLDPEDVRELSATVLARLAEAVALYGGTIDKFMGDAVMALFGAPVAHEDDALRAVHAALAMHQAMAALGQPDDGGETHQVRLRIGINSGEVVAGARDIGGHREYSVFGDVVNTAARLQVAAAPGTILLGAETARQVSRVFDLVPVEPLKLRGKSQPVPAFTVRGKLQRGVPALSERTGGSRLPLVGRLTELRQLRQQLQDLSRGRGQLTAVVGEHGVGKSRLLAEAREYAVELGLGWVEAAAPSHAQTLSYRLIRETLARLLSLQPDLAGAGLAGSLADRLEQLGLGDRLAPLAFILGVEIEDDPLAGLSAQKLQWRVVDAMRQVLRAFAAERPLVLVLDALQWADPSSIDLLVDLMPLTDEVPILFVYVFTPDPDAPSWQLKEQAARALPHRYVEVALGPLSERAARELMCSLLACAETPAHVEELVLERTDRNPYFIEEVLRALIESGALRRDGGRWVADGDVRELHIPDTLIATVMARIDRLPAGVRRMLQVAAVIGREVPERVLRRVVDGGPELDRYIREALRAGLLREEAVIPERRFAFTQVLIQEAALRSLLLRRRREIHVQIGWGLEEIYADNLEEQYAELARHFWEGEAWERAFRYSRLAAEQAAAAYANDEAVLNFTMAIESAHRSAAGASPEVVALLSERRADVRALIGDYAEALADYRAALAHHEAHLDDAVPGSVELAQEAVHVGALALKAARLHSYQGQIDETRAAVERALALLPPDSPDLSSVWSLKAFLHVWASDTAAAAQAGLRALALARERGTYQHVAEAYEALTAPSMVGAAGIDQARLTAEWVALARERPEDRPALFKALVARGLVHVWGLWMFDESLRADVTEAIALAWATGSLAGENTARGILGAGLVLLGEWPAAEPELRQAAGQPSTLIGAGSIFEWWLMLLLTLRGDLESSAREMGRWLADTAVTHRRVVMRALLAWNRLLAGEDDTARAALAEAVGAAEELGCEHCAVTLDTIAADVLAELGDLDAAAVRASAARAAGERLGRRVSLLAADRADAVVALGRGRPQEARALLERTLAEAEALGQPYEVARTLRWLAEAVAATGDAAAAARHRARALELFDRLGAAPDARRLRTRSGQPLQV